MEHFKRKRWIYAIMVVWCVVAGGLQFSTLKHLPIDQTQGNRITNTDEDTYCGLPGVRNKTILLRGILPTILTPHTNYWMCKDVVRQHNRDFALALLWIILPPALVLLALWFPPSFRSKRR